MSRAEDVVRDFCQAFSRQNVEELLRFFADDAVYHNIPIEPVQGKAAIEAMLRQFIDPNGEASFEIKLTWTPQAERRQAAAAGADGADGMAGADAESRDAGADGGDGG